jgi:acyl-CoA thioester hydrolase
MSHSGVAPITRQVRLRVRYADTDRMGVVYYANYLVWFEVARTEWLRDTGWSYREMEEDGISLPVIEAQCEYRRPVRYDDEIEILTRATLVTPIRIRFDYEVRQLGASAAAAIGHTVHAALDEHGRPRRLPARVRDLVERPTLPESQASTIGMESTSPESA